MKTDWLNIAAIGGITAVALALILGHPDKDQILQGAAAMTALGVVINRRGVQ